MRWLTIGACLFFAGCGVNDGEFKTQFEASYCSWLLECGDQAVLTFDGIETEADCAAIVGADIFDWGASCKYKGGKAKKCLDAMSTLSCPSDGSFDFSLPAECTEVYPGCALDLGAESDTDTDTDADSDTDTDTDTDSDTDLF